LARGASYIFELNGRWSIDGSPRRNVARYINHSCRPNAKPVHRNGGILIVALHRIEPGEEITYDYGREYLNYFLDNGGCRCAACRKAARRRKSKTGRGRGRRELRVHNLSTMPRQRDWDPIRAEHYGQRPNRRTRKKAPGGGLGDARGADSSPLDRTAGSTPRPRPAADHCEACDCEC
jgi:hypothetical protein